MITTPTELRAWAKAWMKQHNKTPIDLAAALQVDPDTVKRFLSYKTRRPHRLFMSGLRALAASQELLNKKSSL